jgi:hypothetical protein
MADEAPRPAFQPVSVGGETAWFLAVTGLLVPALSAIAGAWLAHSASGIPYWSAWRDWYAAHALGLVSFSPPLLLAMRARAACVTYHAASCWKRCPAGAVFWPRC